MTRRKVEAWRVSDGETTWVYGYEFDARDRVRDILDAAADRGLKPYSEIEPLFGREPDAERVVRAAVNFVTKGKVQDNDYWTDLDRAVERLQKSRAKRRR